MTSSLGQSLSKLNMNAVENQKIILKYIKNQFQQGKTVFKGYETFCKKFGDDAMKYKDFDFWWYRFKNGLNDLDYDRSKDPETHEFSDFPVEIVKKLIEKSEWKEKLILRNVSKGFRETVDNLKHSFSQITLYIDEEKAQLLINKETQFDHDDEFSKNNEKREKFYERAFADLASILSLPKLKTDELCLRFFSETNYRQYIDAIKTIFSSLNRQLLTKEVFLTVRNVEGVLAVFPYLKPEFLQCITIMNNKPMDYAEIVKMDQWKKAKRVFLLGNGNCPIESLLHFDRFGINLRRMSIGDFKKIKKAVLASPNFEYCAVTISNRHYFDALKNSSKSDPIPIPGTDSFIDIDFKSNYFEIKKRSQGH